MEGAEIVQLYIRDKVARIARPVKELKAFERIVIKPGETQRVTFTITPDILGYYDSNGKFVFDPGEFEIMVGPDSHSLQIVTYNVN